MHATKSQSGLYHYGFETYRTLDDDVERRRVEPVRIVLKDLRVSDRQYKHVSPQRMTIVDAVPGCIRDFFSCKPNLNSSTPKIAKRPSPDARVETLNSHTDHSNFRSAINSVKSHAESQASYYHNIYDAQAAIPYERTTAYLNHNLKVLEKTPVGGKISMSRSQSGRNNVYHQVKE